MEGRGEGEAGTCLSQPGRSTSNAGLMWGGDVIQWPLKLCPWASLGAPLNLVALPCTFRPLKNASDGALMDDNQNEWGDEDLETKKFRVSLVNSWAFWGSPTPPGLA